MQEFPRMNSLPSGGLYEAGKDAVSFQSAFRSRSEAYLAEDHEFRTGQNWGQVYFLGIALGI